MAKFCKKCGCVIDDGEREYCMACLEELENIPLEYQGYASSSTGLQRQVATPQNSIHRQQEDKNLNDNWLVGLLKILAGLELIAGIVFAFVGGIDNSGYSTEFSPIIFFGCLIGGIIGFAVLAALSVFVKAANKYLNS
ncbi:MAG: hypothetical protein NC226_09320 [Bacteroides cellulosilyticus]|nr:hypothetical protein [Bacteroides cellulosilyticus]